MNYSQTFFKNTLRRVPNDLDLDQNQYYVGPYYDIGPTKGQLSEQKMLKIAIIFLSITLNMCFGCSKEPYH